MKEELEELEKTTDVLKEFQPRIAKEVVKENVPKVKVNKKLADLENKTLVLSDLEDDKTIKFDKTTAMDKLNEVIKQEQYDNISNELENSLIARKKQKRLGIALVLIAFVFLPILILFIVIGSHSSELINKDTLATLKVGLAVSLIVMVLGLVFFFKNINISLELKLPRICYSIYSIIMLTYGVFCASILLLLYGLTDFKDWIITTAMNTTSHQHYATWFYSDDEINESLKRVAEEESKTYLER